MVATSVIFVLVVLVGAARGLELYYFNEKGRAEPIRLMLHYAGTNFTDFRFSRADWNTSKDSMLFHTIPALVQDSDLLENSEAITRYVAQTAGLLTASYIEDAQLDSLFEQSGIVLRNLLEYISIVEGRKPGNATNARYRLVEYPCQLYYPLIEQHIFNDTGFFGRYGITYFDFVWFNLSDLINSYAFDVLAKYPVSSNHWWNVMGYNNSNLQNYFQTRGDDFLRNETFTIYNYFNATQ
ncbi:unnamed protein product [Bursaphelenchus xylophilus]|uniref:(pine wood nematode) hypothetical protein n=1 Tax=Bursaphelenchus xylophilus TaxID=6326 RepID=A0A1I7RQJ3_BURXY|nr:unnamed protein product [Bursaphelenchus xylophilus]CAG9104683.1 unnamed protein product [Bursaphelenchus xylophilus]